MQKQNEAKTFKWLRFAQIYFVWILRAKALSMTRWGVDSHILDCHDFATQNLAMTEYYRFVADSRKARIAIEVIAVVLWIILARNERNRTWASIE